MCLRSCLVHGLDGSSRSKALSSQGQGAFFFSRVATRAMTEPFAPLSAKVPRAGNFVLPRRRRVFPFVFGGGHLVGSEPSQAPGRISVQRSGRRRARPPRSIELKPARGNCEPLYRRHENFIGTRANTTGSLLYANRRKQQV